MRSKLILFSLIIAFGIVGCGKQDEGTTDSKQEMGMNTAISNTNNAHAIPSQDSSPGVVTTTSQTQPAQASPPKMTTTTPPQTQPASTSAPSVTTTPSQDQVTSTPPTEDATPPQESTEMPTSQDSSTNGQEKTGEETTLTN